MSSKLPPIATHSSSAANSIEAATARVLLAKTKLDTDQQAPPPSTGQPAVPASAAPNHP